MPDAPPYAPHTSAWRDLRSHAARLEGRTLRDLFAADGSRFEAFSCEAD